MACGLLNPQRAPSISYSISTSGKLTSGCHMFSTCVRMMIEWFVPLGQTRSILMALHSVAAETRSSSGCVGGSVPTDIGSRGTMRYTEEWLTEDDLRRHMLTDTFEH